MLSIFRFRNRQKEQHGVEYVDSWGFDRGYRGNAGSDRVHEGTDIMCINNVEGLYPVVSVCDGTVTKKGWLSTWGV